MSDYNPPRIYRNGHCNTIAAASLMRKAYALNISSEFRKQSECITLSLLEDIQLQGLINKHSTSEPKPLVMILHGWLGCADSLYLLPLASKLFKQGFNIFRLNFRDHGGTEHLNRELFHSCRLTEVLDATKNIQQKIPHSKFYIIGFSLGGNFALRIGAEAKNKDLSIDKIISVCPVMDAANALNETKSMPKLYTEYYLQRWKSILKTKHKHYPDSYDLETINHQRTLTAMTEHLLLQYTEFDSVKDYLEGYSITGDCLNTLTIDSDVYIAEDDPVIPANDHKNLYASSFLKTHLTRYGGHCGYLDNIFGLNWIDKNIIKTLNT